MTGEGVKRERGNDRQRRAIGGSLTHNLYQLSCRATRDLICIYAPFTVLKSVSFCEAGSYSFLCFKQPDLTNVQSPAGCSNKFRGITFSAVSIQQVAHFVPQKCIYSNGKIIKLIS